MIGCYVLKILFLFKEIKDMHLNVYYTLAYKVKRMSLSRCPTIPIKRINILF
jgi:hypothetical protein